MARATRERKIRFINGFGRSELRAAITEAIRRHGDDFLTDEQIDIITSERVEHARYEQHRMLRNRPIIRAAGGLS